MIGWIILILFGLAFMFIMLPVGAFGPVGMVKEELPEGYKTLCKTLDEIGHKYAVDEEPAIGIGAQTESLKPVIGKTHCPRCGHVDKNNRITFDSRGNCGVVRICSHPWHDED